MFEFQAHDWIAVFLTAMAVGIYIILLCYNGYSDYREAERRRQNRKRKGQAHG